MQASETSRTASANGPAAPGLTQQVQFATVQIDYQATQDLIKLLTDIRFRLLGFVPVFSTVGVTLITAQAFGAPTPVTMLAIGLLGFSFTLGLILYDLRNSSLYDGYIHRAKLLEKVMGCVQDGTETLSPSPAPIYILVQSADAATQAINHLGAKPRSDEGRRKGGAHTQRAPAYYTFLRIPVKHDAALALVYAAALGAWLFPIAKGSSIMLGGLLLSLGNVPRITHATGLATSLVALAAAATGFSAFFQALRAADNPRAANALTSIFQDEGVLDGNGEEDWKNRVTDYALGKMYERVKKHWFAHKILKPMNKEGNKQRDWEPFQKKPSSTAFHSNAEGNGSHSGLS